MFTEVTQKLRLNILRINLNYCGWYVEIQLNNLFEQGFELERHFGIKVYWFIIC